MNVEFCMMDEDLNVVTSRNGVIEHNKSLDVKYDLIVNKYINTEDFKIELKESLDDTFITEYGWKSQIRQYYEITTNNGSKSMDEFISYLKYFGINYTISNLMNFSGVTMNVDYTTDYIKITIPVKTYIKNT